MKKQEPPARSKVSRSPRPLGSPARARTSPAPATTIQKNTELQHALHELQVHQEELETQNVELRETQQLLEASRDRYADLYDFAPIGFATLDEKGHIREINLTGATILGWERSRLLGTLFGVSVAKGDLSAFHGHLRQCQQGRGPVTTELTLAVPDRDPVPVQLHSVPILDLTGRTTMYRTAITDVTAHKQAEEKLRQAHDQLEDRVQERTAELAGVVAKLRKEIADRERAEASLRLQDLIVKNMAEGVCLVRVRDSVIMYANPTFEKIFGYDLGELNGKHVSVVNHGLHDRNAKQVAREIIDELIADGIASYEVQNVRKDGTPFWCRAHTSTFEHPEHGSIWVAVHEDITERKRAERAMQQLAAIVESSDDAIISETLDGTILSWNKGAQRIYGYTAKEMIGHPASILFPKDGLDAFQEILKKIKGGEGINRLETARRRKDGKLIHVSLTISPIKDATGKAIAACAIGHDMTRRKRAEEALRASEEGQRTLFESAPDPIVVVDAEGRMERVNRQTEVMFGYQRSELIGQPMEMLMPERFRGHHERHRAGFIASPHLRPMGAGVQLYGRRKDGSEFPVDIMLSPLASKPNPLVIAVVRDVTERKQTEQALRQLSVRLQQSQDEERRRIARELHDSTGQKLAALAMNLSLIGKSAETLDARARQALTDSLTLLERSSRDIRTLSYLLHPPLLDECGLAAAVRWFADGFTQRSGVQVQLEVPADLQRLPEKVEMTLFRIVQEGLSNTHRHSGSSTATIRLMVDQNHVQLEMRDAGKGLPKPRSDGYVAPLGVGIAGMHERVKELNGHMKIDSDANGTTICVTLPLRGDRP